MKHRVFVQSELLTDIVLLEVEPDVAPGQLRKSLLALIEKEAGEEAVHVYIEDEDDENALQALARVSDGLRVHLHRQKGIDVIVRYAGRDVRRTFRPSATVARVKKWAARELGITPSDAAELMLQVTGTDTRPDSDTHIGSLVRSPAKHLSFDLVPSPRVNG